MAKSDNLLAILWMLRSRERMTAAQIAGELEVDIRTVYRYIDALSMSGAPIIAEPGPNGGYGLLDTFRDTPLFFSAQERIALAHAGLFTRQAGYPYSNALSSALSKVERHLSPDQLEELQQHATGLAVVESAAGSELISIFEEVEGEHGERYESSGEIDLEEGLRAIEGAVAERIRLHISHIRATSEPPLDRLVDPYGLVYWRERWYLVGYCHLRKAIRMFRCDRIVAVEATSQQFQRPDNFSARSYFLHTMLPMDAATPETTVRVRGTPYAIDLLVRHWFLGNFIRERSDREVGLAVDVGHASDHLPYLVLSCASELEIVEPRELREEVARAARRIAETHESPEHSTSQDSRASNQA